MNKIFIITFFLSLPFLIFSQNLKTEEIKVSKDFQAEIPDAFRINNQAYFIDTLKKEKSQDYSILSVDFNSKFNVRKLNAASMRQEIEYDSSKNIFSIATGFKTLVNSKVLIERNKDNLTYGFIFNNLQNRYKINNIRSDNSNSNIISFLKHSTKTRYLDFNLNYNRRIYYCYAHKFETINEALLENRFSYLNFSTTIASRYKNNLNSMLSFFISDFNEGSENLISVKSHLNKKVDKKKYGVKLIFDNHLNYNSSQNIENIESANSQLIMLNPYFDFYKYNIKFNTGIKINYESNDEISFFPNIKGEKELVKDIISIYFGLQSNNYRNTYKSLSDDNPYIHVLGTNQTIIKNDTIQQLKTTKEKEVFFGIKNRLSKTVLWHSSIHYGLINNFIYFDNNYKSDFNKFLANYIDVQQLKISSKYNQKISNILSFDLNGEYYNWNKEDISHKSNLIFDASLNLNLRDKIIIYPQVVYKSRQKSFADYELEERVHLNINLKYNYSNLISCFVNLNNVTNSQKFEWRDYKELGFNGHFGILFSL